MTEGVFPGVLKHAIVQPRLKKPTLDPAELSSYLPISNLSFIARPSSASSLHVSLNTSRLNVCCRLTSRSIELTIRPRLQSQPSTMSSCATSIPAVSVLVLLDLRAAFDTVDHSTLLEVLGRRFGVKGTALDWFDSYLADRTQSFQQGAQRSEPYRVYCSVIKVRFSVPRSLLLMLKTWMTYRPSPPESPPLR